MGQLDELKIILKEKEFPYFEDEELQYYLKKYGSLEETAYHCLLIKAENTTVSVSGLSLEDTSKYFLRMAQTYRPSNSGTLCGG